MDYKEKLKEALNSDNTDYEVVRWIEQNFPELKESGDERIRKELLQIAKESEDSFYMVMTPNKREKLIAWLEKQEQKTNPCDGCINRKGCINCENGELRETGHKPVKVEPKFHEGEWITNGDYTWKIVEVKPLDYILQSQDGNIVDDTISYVDKQFHSFTIEDAKDGDVVVDKSDGAIGIFQSIGHHPDGGSCNDPSYCFLHCRYDDGFFYADFEHGNTIDSDDLIPATKEQCDTLEKVMTNYGYRWNKEELKLEKI